MISSFIITGFLGVGKTTLLTKSVQEHFDNKKIAIIVNEFGEIGIDGNILKNVHSEVLEISEGCICCQLASELESGVLEIMDKYKPDMLLIETSGASEPLPIFLSLQNLGINVEGIICVIDSKNFHTYKDNSTAKYQVAGSNLIVLNKTDLVTNEQIEELANEIKEIKSEYNIKNTLTEEDIFNNYLTFHASNGIVDKKLFEGVYTSNEIIELAKDHQHLEHTTKDSITQKVLYLKNGVSFSQIDEVLNTLPKNIYRAKGIVKTTDIPNPLLVNYSFGDTSFEELPEYNEKSLLIFIGENITEDIKALNQNFEILMMPQFSISPNL